MGSCTGKKSLGEKTEVVEILVDAGGCGRNA